MIKFKLPVFVLSIKYTMDKRRYMENEPFDCLAHGFSFKNQLLIIVSKLKEVIFIQN